MTLYDKLKEAGCQMDNHESDLYVESTEVSQAIIKEFGMKGKPFISRIDQAVWLDIPFQFQPYWDRKRK